MDNTIPNGYRQPLPTSTQIAITATSQRCCGLANSIIEHVTSHGGHICEIQMYDHERTMLSAMLLRARFDTHRISVDDTARHCLGAGDSNGRDRERAEMSCRRRPTGGGP